MLELDGGFEPSLEMMVDFLEEFLICEFEGIDLCGLMIVLLHNTVYLTICVLLWLVIDKFERMIFWTHSRLEKEDKL